jgi:probable F420-dependent oxidoreductase
VDSATSVNQHGRMSLNGKRPFRFGLIWMGETSPVEVARRAEDGGYATLLFPDHTGMVAPLPAMGAAAAVTSRIRLGTQVINIAFRPLGALAQELAAVDIVSRGRLEIGLGAGYAESELRSLGLPIPSAGERTGEVARALDVLPRLFAGETVTEEPGPRRLADYVLKPAPPQGAAVPLMVGGNGNRVLGVAAERATIVQFTGFTATPTRGFRHFSEAGLADRVAYVQGVAGDRFRDLELGVLVQRAGTSGDQHAVGKDLAEAAHGAVTPEEALSGPYLLLGETDAICDRVVELRERYGVSYLTVFDGRSDGFDEVVARLAGS